MPPDKPDTMTKADLVTGVVLIAVSAVVVEESWRMPRFEELNVNPYSVPGIVPGILGVILLILGIVLTTRSILRGGHRLGWSRQSLGQCLADSGIRRLLVAVVLTVGYAGGLVGWLPYWLATFLFVFLFVAYFEWDSGRDRRRITLFAFILAACTSGLVTWVFSDIFLVTLP